MGSKSLDIFQNIFCVPQKKVSPVFSVTLSTRKHSSQNQSLEISISVMMLPWKEAVCVGNRQQGDSLGFGTELKCIVKEMKLFLKQRKSMFL